MLALVDRSPAWLDKPTEVSRREGTRLPWAWDGLCFAVPFYQASNEGYREVVNNNLPTTVTGSWAWKRDPRGNPAFESSNASSTVTYMEWADNPTLRRPSTEITVYARVQRTGASDTWGGVIAREHTVAGPLWTSWAITDDGAATGKLTASIAVGGTFYDLGSVTVASPTTQYCSLFLRWRSGQAPRLDVLGERGDTITQINYGSAITGSIDYSTGKATRINAVEQTNSNYNGRYSQAMVWARRLNDVEITALVADPFGWFAPHRESVVFAGPFPIVVPGAVAAAAGTSPFSGATITPTIVAGVPTSYTVTAGPDFPANFTRTVSGTTTQDTVAAGATQAFPTGAATAADVTYVGLDTEDTGV